jgi:hypothetical protein
VNGRRLGLAAAAALILAAAVWLLEFERPRREAARLETASRLLTDAEALTGFRVQRGDATYSLRPVAQGGWRVTASTLDEELIADVRAVDFVSDALLSSRLKVIAEDVAQAGPLEDFGLETERLRVSWSTGDGERSILLGRPVPPDGRRNYGLIDDQLVTVQGELVKTTAWGLDHWRLKTVLQFSPDDLRRIEIQRPRETPPGVSPRLVLSLDEHPQGTAGWWRVLEPVDAPALPARTRGLMTLLYRLQADAFVADHPDEAALAKAGLSPPSVVLTVVLTDGRERVLRLGDQRTLTAEEIAAADGRELLAPLHARVDDGPLVLVRPDLLSSSMLADDAYRDNRALPVPELRIVSILYEKPNPEGAPFVLELYRELQGDWRAARPADATVPQKKVSLLIGSLQQVLFGRFEDEIAADPSGFETVYDLSEPETFSIEARAIDVDGDSHVFSIQAGPPGAIVRDRQPYRPVLVTDPVGRRTVGVTKFRAFDKFLGHASDLRRRIEESASP